MIKNAKYKAVFQILKSIGNDEWSTLFEDTWMRKDDEKLQIVVGGKTFSDEELDILEFLNFEDAIDGSFQWLG